MTSAEKKPAKVVLRELQDKIAQDAWDAKLRGEKVGWCASNFPQEITTAMGIYYAKVVVPATENYDGAETEPVAFIINPTWLDIDFIEHNDAPFEILLTLYPDINALLSDVADLDKESLIALLESLVVLTKEQIKDSLDV